ncbi:hypothetical protein BKD09_34510 [Bradyrhizobium japonicum]|uniref:Uncharacterized protein n=1 Tax=Bradyrhizobium japonicum TaxID=375 RepID=A0A1L3FJL2_BRAJP|nr:hypothetical protein BKD09_34510 [Bradyrhizobium japonicum]
MTDSVGFIGRGICGPEVSSAAVLVFADALRRASTQQEPHITCAGGAGGMLRREASRKPVQVCVSLV